MDILQLQCALLSAFLVASGILLIWWIMMLAARDWVFRIHTKWFKLSREQFDAIHYAGIMFFKILVIVLFLVPYIALKIAL